MKNRKKQLLETYSLIKELSSISGPHIDSVLLDRVMYSAERLPPLGKEYWWFLFFGQDKRRPMQFMQLIFRKYGRKMLFNNKEMIFEEPRKERFKAITAGWIYDGRNLLDLGDTNTCTEISDNKIATTMSDREMILAGSFPNYTLRIGEIIDLETEKGGHLANKEAHGVFLPPFGMGWINIFLDTHGTVFGRKFEGTAHLQKVVGVTIFGPFHWGRAVFKNGSSVSFFCLKTGKNSKTYFHKSLTFCDSKNKEIIKFRDPELEISKENGNWTINGRDREKEIGIVLKIHAAKQYSMKNGGSQNYIEYVVVPKELSLKTESRIIVLDDLGGGVGTFEDAYW